MMRRFLLLLLGLAGCADPSVPATELVPIGDTPVPIGDTPVPTRDTPAPTGDTPVVAHVGGASGGAAWDGEWIVLGRGPRVEVLNASLAPVWQSEILPAMVTDLAAADGQAVVATARGAWRLALGSEPELTPLLDRGHGPVAASDGWWAVGDESFTGDRLGVVRVGRWDSETDYDTLEFELDVIDLAIEGDRFAVLVGDSVPQSAYLYQLSDGAPPVRTSEVPLSDASSGFGRIALSPDRLAVSDADRIRALSLTDPAQPTLLAELATEGPPGSHLGWTDLGLAFTDSAGLHLWPAVRPDSAPRLMAPGVTGTVAPEGNRTLITTNDRADLTLIDLAVDPVQPLQAPSTPGRVDVVAALGSRHAVVGSDRTYLLDLSDPSQPTVVDVAETGRVVDIATAEDLVAVLANDAQGSELTLLTATDGNLTPLHTSVWSFDGVAVDVTRMPDEALGDSATWWRVVTTDGREADVSQLIRRADGSIELVDSGRIAPQDIDPTPPHQVGAVLLSPDGLLTMAARRPDADEPTSTSLFVFDWPGPELIDGTPVPMSAQRTATIDGPGLLGAMARSEDTLLAGLADGGLWSVSLSAPADADSRSGFPVPHGIAVTTDGQVYVPSTPYSQRGVDEGSLHTYQLLSQGQVTPIGRVDLPGTPRAAAVLGDHVLVATGAGGLYVLER